MRIYLCAWANAETPALRLNKAASGAGGLRVLCMATSNKLRRQALARWERRWRQNDAPTSLGARCSPPRAHRTPLGSADSARAVSTPSLGEAARPWSSQQRHCTYLEVLEVEEHPLVLCVLLRIEDIWQPVLRQQGGIVQNDPGTGSFLNEVSLFSCYLPSDGKSLKSTPALCCKACIELYSRYVLPRGCHPSCAALQDGQQR